MSKVIVLLVGFIVGLIITALFERFLFTNENLKEEFYDNPKLIFGYHVHHSLIGLLLSMVGIYFLPDLKSFFLVGFGAGVVAMHTIADKRLVFIEKKNPR